MEHAHGCQIRDHSSAAKRCSDAVNLHVSAIGFDAARKFVAVSLADGRSDNVLYDTKADAVRHQTNEFTYAYVCIPPSGMSVCQAESFMATNRKLYDAGFRMSDPRDVIPPLMAKGR